MVQCALSSKELCIQMNLTRASNHFSFSVPLEPDLNSAVYNSSFSRCINLAETRHLVRRENDLSKASLPRISDVFEIDKQTVLTEHLLAKDSQHPVGLRSETISQKLAARVVRLDTRFKRCFSFKKQSGIDPAFGSERQNLIAGQILRPRVGERVAGKQFCDVVREPHVRFESTTRDRLRFVHKFKYSALTFKQHEGIFYLCVEEHLVNRIRELLADTVPVINIQSSAPAALGFQAVPDRQYVLEK